MVEDVEGEALLEHVEVRLRVGVGLALLAQALHSAPKGTWDTS